MNEPQALLITDDYLPHLGGSRIYYHQVASMLAPGLSVLTRKRAGDGDFDSKTTYRIRRVPLATGVSHWRSQAEIVDCLTLARKALTWFPEIKIYVAGELNPSCMAAFIAAKRRGGAYGVVLHDEPLAGAGKVESKLRAWLLRKAGVIITASSFSAKRVHDIVGDAVPVFNAPPGVDANVFCPGPADESVLRRYGGRKSGYVLCVGRLVDYKNISAVIESIAHLRESGLGLLVVGEGPCRAELESQALSLGVEDRVVFAGLIASEDLVELYRGAVAYVFPSRPAGGQQHEGIGMAVLEAAACGCTIIASTVTSAGDFVEDGQTGFLFDPMEDGALTRLLHSVVSCDERARTTGLQAAERVRRRFKWENTAAVFRDALRMLESRA